MTLEQRFADWDEAKSDADIEFLLKYSPKVRRRSSLSYDSVLCVAFVLLTYAIEICI